MAVEKTVDKKTIGITPGNERVLAALAAEGLFASEIEAAKFAMAHAINVEFGHVEVEALEFTSDRLLFDRSDLRAQLALEGRKVRDRFGRALALGQIVSESIHGGRGSRICYNTWCGAHRGSSFESRVWYTNSSKESP